MSDDPTREVWRLLRFFLDERRVVKRLRDIHAIPTGHDSNLRKQARQLGQSVRQAQEYFHAAGTVSLATRPTLLYYGAVSLSRALILLRLDGTHSYDALRAHDRHNHHGLELTRSFLSLPTNDEPQALLDSMRMHLHVHQVSAEPWGNFPLFHKALSPPAILLRNEVTDVGGATVETRDEVMAGVVGRKLESLESPGVSVLTLVQQMPDLWPLLVELEIPPAVCPGRVATKTLRTVDATTDPPMVTHVKQNWEFWIWGASSTEQVDKFAGLIELNPRLQINTRAARSISFKLEETQAPDQHVSTYVPDMIDALSGRICFIPDYEDFLLEPASHLATLFSLSMLARYYPDVWMAWLETNPVFAELLDSVLVIIERKFPLLILDQLTGLKHYVSWGYPIRA